MCLTALRTRIIFGNRVLEPGEVLGLMMTKDGDLYARVSASRSSR
jgi:hypothetical protein